jgi:hypothetical protein
MSDSTVLTAAYFIAKLAELKYGDDDWGIILDIDRDQLILVEHLGDGGVQQYQRYAAPYIYSMGVAEKKLFTELIAALIPEADVRDGYYVRNGKPS